MSLLGIAIPRETILTNRYIPLTLEINEILKSGTLKAGPVIQLCPILTGGGSTLFPQHMNFDKLTLLEVRQYNTGTVFLNYESIK